MALVANPPSTSWLGSSYLGSTVRSVVLRSWWSSPEPEPSDDTPVVPGRGPLCNPILCKILARRWIKATNGKHQARGVHPVVCKIIAHRWVKSIRKRTEARLLQPPRFQRFSPERQEELQGALVEQLVWQRDTPLCLDNVERLYAETRDMILGDRIYRLVVLIESKESAGKVTGMLLEGFSTEEIFNMLFVEDATIAASLLLELIAEAHDVLRDYAEEQLELATPANGQAEDAVTGLLGSASGDTIASADDWTVVHAKSRRRQRAQCRSPERP